MHIKVDNVNQGLAEGIRYLAAYGGREDSRNGPVLVADEPVITTYLNPRRRVLFSPKRDANPFFHVMEALWMLAGRKDVHFVARYAANMLNFSDDGFTLNGAYGYRWINYFGVNQLEAVAEELERDPGSRRAVLAMWDVDDLDKAANGCRDVPCNTHAYFRLNEDKALDLTVCCRSNDIIWGCYGANAVHFSFLLEYMAARLSVGVGAYHQVSNNFHMYTRLTGSDPAALREYADEVMESDRYIGAVIRTPPVALVRDLSLFKRELPEFLNRGGEQSYLEPFLGQVAAPMWRAWEAHKQKDHHRALVHAVGIADEAWGMACIEWLQRRAAKQGA